MVASIARILGEGFRVFFLAAGFFGVFTGVIWVFYLDGVAVGPALSQMPVMWHAHEMIFGYGTAAIGGFFLTAVPNWTNAPGARQGFIMLASGLWLAGRLAVWNASQIPPMFVAVIDLAFIPVLALKILSQLMKRPKPQNMMFLLFLTYLWVANLQVHLEWLGVTSDTAVTGLRAGLTTICALISVLGGRVTPAFTRNAMKRAGQPEAAWPHSNKWIERAALILAIALPVMVLTGLPGPIAGPVEIVFGIVQLLRLGRWRARWCLNKPILLALHLGLLMLAAGMILLGLSGLGIGSELAGLHVLGIGCVGGMTLAVMSRAALGHSGRELVAPTAMAAGYGVIALAALTRWAGTAFPSLYEPAMLAAAGLWILAFCLYLGSMWPALTGPRAAN